MVSKMKLKHFVVYENILHENVGQCGIKVKVTVAFAKFNHLILQITSRWLFVAESGKREYRPFRFLTLLTRGTKC